MRRTFQFVLQLAIVVMLAAGARAQIIDRVVASVGKKVITLSDVQREQRMVCYLNGGPTSLTKPEEIRAMAEKLVDQLLIRQELETGTFVPGPKEELDSVVLASRARFPNDAAYRAALGKCGVTEKELFAYLALQSTVLDFIDFRVLPGLQIPSDDVQQYYDKELVVAWMKRNEAAQPLDTVREKITSLLRERQVNERLDAWLKELHGQAEIRVR